MKRIIRVILQILILALVTSARVTGFPMGVKVSAAGDGVTAFETQQPLSIPMAATATPPGNLFSLDLKITPSPLLTKTPISTATPTATPTWVWNSAGEAIVPILLFHHIADVDPPSRYFVSVANFQKQIKTLRAWGYTSIPLSRLVQAVEEGVELPPRPVILTFDDGYMDVYDNALPVMENYGLVGVSYIIVNQLEIGGFLHVKQLKEMLDAGWEIGSHTNSHVDLRQEQVDLSAEISGSKETLENLLDVQIETFSFPYGMTTPYATQLVRDGYQNAVGLGGFFRHVPETRYYLSRIEIQGDFDLSTFASLLPWRDLENLPDDSDPSYQ